MQTLVRLVRALWLRTVAAILLVAAVICGVWFWLAARPPAVPSPENRVLFNGIHYRREVLRQPRPVVAHILKIDLRAPGVAFLVTPAELDGPLPLKARTTSLFLEKYRTQIAVNGDFFAPWHSRFLWDYYPHNNDPVQVDGMAISRGQEYSRGRESSPVLVISRDNRAAIFDSPQAARKSFAPGIYNAISGNTLLIRNSHALPAERWHKDHNDLHPRTALGLNKARDQLIILVVDGRQAGYSEGVSLRELAALLLHEGVDTAINLDGGGSATMVMETKNGTKAVLNSPIDNHIPGRERPVANHLGIFAFFWSTPVLRHAPSHNDAQQND